MFSLELLFLSHGKPGSVKEGFKEETPVLGRQVFENTPEETLGRMVWVFQETAYPGNGR
jgi:hypothetical protein